MTLEGCPMPVEPSASQPGQVLVILPRPLLALFPEAKAEVKVSAATVGDMIAALNAQWPGIRDRLCDETPRIRRHLSIFCNGERAALDTPLPDNARIYVLTAVSGG
jgi:molybdopterin converting factor small subunit